MKKKIKLRDMTPEQYQDYLNNRCAGGDNCSNCVLAMVNCQDPECNCSWINNKDFYSKKFLDQEVEIEMPDILTKEEKEYLSAVIRPFKDKVFSIKKLICFGSNSYKTYFINIQVNNEFAILGFQTIELPYFQDNMYEKMEIDKQYTLEELGL